MSYSVTQFGRPLSKDLYSFDEKTKVFTSKEDYLVIDFGGCYNIEFNINNQCTLVAGSFCTINSGDNCKFVAEGSNTFNTGDACTFYTGGYCTFKTSSNCTFTTASRCNFETSTACVFNTGARCMFNTQRSCIMYLYDNFTITLVDDFIVRLNMVFGTVDRIYTASDYYRPELEGFKVNNDELDRLKEFPLDEPRLLFLHVKDELGNRLFNHYKEKGLL